jgi:acetolactate synthase-1/3 small subunit
MPKSISSHAQHPSDAQQVCPPLSAKPSGASSILELVVRNHPGTMSHITGLFARRAFNLEAIVVVPLPGGETSRILLHMADEPKLEQVERQLEKLHDVISVLHRPDLAPEIFRNLMDRIPAASPAPTS